MAETNAERLERVRKSLASKYVYGLSKAYSKGTDGSSELLGPDVYWLIERVEALEKEKQVALAAIILIDEITEKMLMDYEHASAIGAYFRPSAEDLASDVGSVALEALEQMGEDITEGQERVIERKFQVMRESLEFYASQDNWIATITSIADFPCEVEKDQGEKARKALEA